MSSQRRYPARHGDARTAVEILAVAAVVSTVGRLASWATGWGSPPTWWDAPVLVLAAVVVGVTIAGRWRGLEPERRQKSGPDDA